MSGRLERVRSHNVNERLIRTPEMPGAFAPVATPARVAILPPPALVACAAVLALGMLAQPPAARAQSEPLQDLSTFPRTTLEIHSGTATHRFKVWVADTEGRQTQGLMFVRDLPDDEGMIFINCCSGIWMKNTYIPLDIVFVGMDGRIVKIAERAKPFDPTTISAGQPVEATIELKGGEAAVLHLKPGDRVVWRAPGAG
jgi:uncharacterized protein